METKRIIRRNVLAAFAFFAALAAAAAPVDAARAKRAAGRWIVARPAAHLTAKLSKNVAANGEARVTFSKDGETVFYRPAIVAP